MEGTGGMDCWWFKRLDGLPCLAASDSERAERVVELAIVGERRWEVGWVRALSWGRDPRAKEWKRQKLGEEKRGKIKNFTLFIYLKGEPKWKIMQGRRGGHPFATWKLDLKPSLLRFLMRVAFWERIRCTGKLEFTSESGNDEKEGGKSGPKWKKGDDECGRCFKSAWSWNEVRSNWRWDTVGQKKRLIGEEMGNKAIALELGTSNGFTERCSAEKKTHFQILN